MDNEADVVGQAFLRGERRLTVPEYIGLVASCQAAFDAAMAELPPSRQVDLWNAFHPETFLPSSGRRLLWVLRRGVLDDLAPKAEDVLPQTWRPAPTEHEQLAFRAMLEALATGRERSGELADFCNEIYQWPSVQGVAEYLTANLASAVRVAALDVPVDSGPRRLDLPSWALVGTLLDALGAAPDHREIPLAAFTAALSTALGAERDTLNRKHSQLLVEFYFATDSGRQASAPEALLRLRLGFAEELGEALAQESDVSRISLEDRFHELLRPLQWLRLLQLTEGLIGWTALTLVHLPPGQIASDSPFRFLK